MWDVGILATKPIAHSHHTYFYVLFSCFIHFKMLPNFPGELFFGPLNYLDVCCLIFKYLGIFPDSILTLTSAFNSFVPTDYILNSLN